ncbi:MAG: CopG family transcriptional regulator [Leptospiraceae bacterium]|nr:CopG family transcriptional regulator [Leptospiraceae bacterium]MCP5512052.1 CopG family transcriptional regulator [Leptospiraceae bacterium]
MISLRLPKEIVAKLNDLSKKEKKTRTDLIKEAIGLYFEKKKIKITTTSSPTKATTPSAPKSKKKKQSK